MSDPIAAPDLRERIEALPSPSVEAYYSGKHREFIRRADVLALLEGTEEKHIAEESGSDAHLTAEQVVSLHRQLREWTGGYEGEGYLTAYRDGIDTVCNVLADMTKPVILSPRPASPGGSAPPPDETDGDMLARLGMDGRLWAIEFHKTARRLGYSQMDEGWLVGWFANAIMAGYDEARRRHDPTWAIPAPGRASADPSPQAAPPEKWP